MREGKGGTEPQSSLASVRAHLLSNEVPPNSLW